MPKTPKKSTVKQDTKESPDNTLQNADSVNGEKGGNKQPMGTIDLRKLVKNPINPRKIGASEFKRLRKSVAEDAVLLQYKQIVVDQENVIWCGNQRVAAMPANGATSMCGIT